MGKREAPYTRLKRIAMKWAGKAIHPQTFSMFQYPKKTMRTDTWNLTELWERTKAAEQLGYHVRIKAKEDGLLVQYVKDVPDLPWELQ